MRFLAVLFALALGACSEPDVAPVLDEEAFALLSHVDKYALEDAFALADRDGYTADVIVTTLEDGAAVSRDSSVVTTDDPGVLDADGGSLLLRDPIDQALSDDPPYLDPSVREAYAMRVLGDTTIGGVRFQRVQAVLTDTTRELGLKRVWAAVDDRGRVGALEVDRRSDSAIFRERSTVRAVLAPDDDWRPRRVVTDTWTDVPLSEPRHVRVEWTVR
ncbi:hypothetical protein [Rubrivirga sp.]|uniref:hypothetical protein n=1 Tax=Rubrivirga sp. TaxID=1885344 RepID=UPI003C76F85F